MKKMITATLLGGAIVGSLLGAGTANASDTMYRVGTDIQPGDYTYTVNSSDWGSYKLCATANCSDLDDIIDIEVVDGAGATGYLTITPGTKFVKLTNLALTPL